jgi:FkbM family methyltransferase
MNGVSDDNELHVFDNGLRVYKRHLSPVQAARYRVTNLHEPIEEAWFRRLSLIETSEFRFADVGAGIGYYSILLKLLRPSARVFCFEPLREHAEHLALNLTLNGIDRRGVQIFDLAVCDRVGRQAFHQEDFGSRLMSDGTSASSFVDTTTLEAIVAQISGPIDLVKIDVQGDELRVIAGAGSAMSSIHGWIIGTHSHDLHDACLAEMRSRGFAVLFEDEAPPHQPDGLIVAVTGDQRRS